MSAVENLNGLYSGSLMFSLLCSLLETCKFLVRQFSSTSITIVFALEQLKLVFYMLVLFSASK